MSGDPYKRSAKRYDQIIGRLNAGLWRLGLSLCPPRAGLKVLDVGCGTGSLLYLYQQRGDEVHGIDTSDAMLDEARCKLGGSACLWRGSATELPFEDQSFDLVTFSMVLHEMAEPVRSAALQQAVRVSKADGRILIIDFHDAPIRTFKGVVLKVMTRAIEFIAGGEHYRNYRQYMASGAMPSRLAQQGLPVERQKVVAGGNLALFVVRPGEASSQVS